MIEFEQHKIVEQQAYSGFQVIERRNIIHYNNVSLSHFHKPVFPEALVSVIHCF